MIILASAIAMLAGIVLAITYREPGWLLLTVAGMVGLYWEH